MIATPEYNHSIPEVPKNTINWASRPTSDNSFNGKPVAIMGASTGMIGTARAQYHLRQCFLSLNMLPINRPEVMISRAAEKIEQNGTLKDEKAKQLAAPNSPKT
jgi:chromate reductase